MSDDDARNDTQRSGRRGPRAFAQDAASLLKHHLNARGFAQIELVTRWAEIADAVEQELSAYTAGALFEMLMSSYPASDEAIYGQPEFRSMLRAALEDGFALGAAGYARDTVLAMSAWPAKLFDPGVDVRVLFGADDDVHSPDLGLTLTKRIRGAQRDVIDAAGGGLLWSHPDVVLAAAAGLQ